MEETLLVENKKNVYNFLNDLYLLEYKIEKLFINLIVKKDLYSFSIIELLSSDLFKRKVIIKSIHVLNDDYCIYSLCDLIKSPIIKSNSIIICEIDKNMTLQIFANVIFLNNVKGTLILKNENVFIICKKLVHAKIITLKNAKDDLTLSNLYIKGDDRL